MKIAVFGLGNFGKHLSIKLTGMGHEVIAIDHDMDKVEMVKGEVSYAVCLESNDPQAMSTLPLGDVDAAVVAIGENEGANIMTTASRRCSRWPTCASVPICCSRTSPRSCRCSR